MSSASVGFSFSGANGFQVFRIGRKNNLLERPSKTRSLQSRCTIPTSLIQKPFQRGHALSPTSDLRGRTPSAGRAWFEEKEREASGNTADRKSTRLNTSHSQISYAVFCLKK